MSWFVRWLSGCVDEITLRGATIDDLSSPLNCVFSLYTIKQEKGTPGYLIPWHEFCGDLYTQKPEIHLGN